MRILRSLRRPAYGLAATSMLLASMAPVLTVGSASAAQVTTRSIQMSSAAPGATNTIYKVTFNVATTSVVQKVAIDFCSNSPIPGDTTCTAPTAMNVNKSTTSVNNASGISASGWSVDTTNSTNNTIIISNASGASVTAGNTVSFELGNGTTNGITNPTDVATSGNNAAGSFYARIYTYASSSATHSTTTPTGYVDYGGVALSTASTINITARVMETLSFCVYKATCGDTPSLTLGHGTPTAALDASAIDTDTASFSLSTNAQNGADVRLKGDVLKSGSNTIPSAGAAASTITQGTAAFGVRLSTAGSLTGVNAKYNTASKYSYDTANTTGTYGDILGSLSGATNNSVSTLTYAATASNTTPAGIYTSPQQLIATGKF